MGIEDAMTIRKAVVQMQELHRACKLQDIHQMIRWVNTKEEHATRIMTTVAEYFLAQKVKKELLSEHDYHEVLALHHAVMVAAKNEAVIRSWARGRLGQGHRGPEAC